MKILQQENGNKKTDGLNHLFFVGDSIGIRTRVAAVRGRSLDRLTIEPCTSLIILYFYFVVTSIDSIIISFTGLDNSPEDDNVFSV